MLNDQIVESVNTYLRSSIDKALVAINSVESLIDKHIDSEESIAALSDIMASEELSSEAKVLASKIINSADKGGRTAYSSLAACTERLVEAKAHMDRILEGVVIMRTEQESASKLIESFNKANHE